MITDRPEIMSSLICGTSAKQLSTVDHIQVPRGEFTLNYYLPGSLEKVRNDGPEKGVVTPEDLAFLREQVLDAASVNAEFLAAICSESVKRTLGITSSDLDSIPTRRERVAAERSVAAWAEFSASLPIRHSQR